MFELGHKGLADHNAQVSVRIFAVKDNNDGALAAPLALEMHLYDRFVGSALRGIVRALCPTGMLSHYYNPSFSEFCFSN